MTDTDAVMVFDDDCGFCTYWAEYFAPLADVRLVGFSDLDDEPELRERLPPEYESCSHLLTPEARYSCGASFEELFARSDLGRPARPIIERLRRIGAYGQLREWGYRRFAHNRVFWGRFTSRTPPVRREGDAAE
ncbi:DCC1-like thiol-disulfide oxidoreductase family protein [Halovivax gelatinilyticus]|uniref:DCC1-like thiol-disulfide oxidoreductase family protein n=1 Tax=Halovivax gelatinilyticus TaxID=2961597 RepID=UPI0020CA310C|nr:DCC1-like thiol-disulfide oxidoreductase family protein [Halovivax gelatinilyticus]